MAGELVILVNGQHAEVESVNGFAELDRVWEDDTVNLYFPAALTTCSLPDMPQLLAFREGPIVLAGLCESDRGIYLAQNDPTSALTPVTEHTYDTFPWRQSVYRTIHQPENFELVPLYDITDERYTVYFTKKSIN